MHPWTFADTNKIVLSALSTRMGEFAVFGFFGPTVHQFDKNHINIHSTLLILQFSGSFYLIDLISPYNIFSTRTRDDQLLVRIANSEQSRLFPPGALSILFSHNIPDPGSVTIQQRWERWWYVVDRIDHSCVCELLRRTKRRQSDLSAGTFELTADWIISCLFWTEAKLRTSFYLELCDLHLSYLFTISGIVESRQRVLWSNFHTWTIAVSPNLTGWIHNFLILHFEKPPYFHEIVHCVI